MAASPIPKTSVCGALAFDSAVIGADGLEYRCGLQVGETHRAIGRFGSAGEQENFPDHDWWDTFDPTTLPTCSRCSFLPLCWGGCPKRHLEGSQPDIDSEGRFWRAHLPRLIAAGLGEQVPPEFALPRWTNSAVKPELGHPSGKSVVAGEGVEGLAEVAGEGIGGGDGLPSGLYLDGAVSAGGLGEFPD